MVTRKKTSPLQAHRDAHQSDESRYLSRVNITPLIGPIRSKILSSSLLSFAYRYD